MKTVRKLFIEVTLWTLVIAFVLFWVSASVGVREIPIYAAFTTFIAAFFLLLVSPSHQEDESRQYFL